MAKDSRSMQEIELCNDITVWLLTLAHLVGDKYTELRPVILISIELNQHLIDYAENFCYRVFNIRLK
jgi:hypothetical protein